MRKLSLIVILSGLLLGAISPMSMSAKSAKKGLYVFGIAKSFQDSLTYITDIMPLPDAVLNPRTKGMDNIEMYSEQLNGYLLMQGHQGYICTTFYATERKKIEQLYVKMRRKVQKKADSRALNLTTAEFQYKFVDPNTIYRSSDEVPEQEETESEE